MKYAVYMIHESETVYLETLDQYNSRDKNDYAISLGTKPIQLRNHGIALQVATLIAEDKDYGFCNNIK